MQNETLVESDGNEYKCELHQKYQMKLIWNRSALGFRSRIPLPDGEDLCCNVKPETLPSTSKQANKRAAGVENDIWTPGSLMFHFM